MAVNALQYVKNVGKSFGYSAIDVFKEYNPQVAALASGAKDLSSDLYQTVKDFKDKATGIDDEKGFLGKGKDYVKDFRDNLFDDLKTGNWYNKQRISSAEDSMIGDMFGFDESDFDLDNLDFDLDDFDDDSGSDTSDSTAIVASNKESATAVINAMDAVGSKSANAISTATVRSADYIVASNKQNSKALYSVTQRGFNQMTAGIAAVNANISSLVSLGEPLTTHMQNSATFYTTSTQYQKDVLAKLDIIIKNTSPEDTRYTSSKKNTLSSVLTSEGVVDLPAYFEMITNNVKSMTEELGGMLQMMGGPNALARMVTSSPMKYVTSGAMKAIMPKNLKSSMKSFNRTLESFFPAIIESVQGRSGSSGGLLDFLGDVIFPKRDFKRKVDTSNYNHGKVNWTGESEMALKEVIPTYLAAITSALTGGPMTQYDYKRGAFVTRSAVKNLNDNRLNRAAKNAGGEFRTDALSAVSSLGLDSKSQKELEKQIEDFFVKAFEKGGSSITKLTDKDFDYEKFGLTPESWSILRSVMKAYQEVGGQKRSMRAVGDIRLGQERYSNETRDIENTNDVIRSLFDNSTIIMNGDKDNKKRPGGIIGTDDYGHDVFFYLQELYKSNWYLAENIGWFGYNGFGSGGGMTVGGRPMPNVPIIGGPSIRKVRDIKTNPNSDIASEANAEASKATKNTSSKYNGSMDTTAEQVIIDRIRYNLQSDSDENSYKGEKSTKKANAEKERKRRREEAEILGVDFDEDDIADDTGESFLDRINNKYGSGKAGGSIRKIFDKVSSIFNKPAEVISEILGAGEQSLYNLVFGKDENSEEKGIFGYFFSKADDMFKKFDEFMGKNFFGKIKEWVKDLFGKENEGGRSLGGDIKDSLGQAWGWTKNKMGDILKGKGAGVGQTQETNIGRAARGRKVTKTGVVAVSKGELIVPARYNPYYHGARRSTKSQLASEADAINNFYGSYAPGGTVGDDRDAYQAYWENVVDYNDDGSVNIGRSNRNSSINRAQNSKFSDLGVMGILGASASKLVNGFQDAVNYFVPKDPKKEAGILDKIMSEENSKRLKDADVGGEVKKNRGGIGAGAIIGAGASILTGCLVGPLAGAAIGAGAGLVINSDKVQRALFGDEVVDEDGNKSRKGGIIPKKYSDFITQKLPNIGIGAGIGGVAGLFMGSPVLGAFLGAGISFAAQSDKVKNAIFGEKDENGDRKGGYMSKEVQDKLKKALPNMGAGAIAGLVAGPFGIAGNIVLGSAVGYATTTDKFKDMILGQVGSDGERHGGIAGQFRDYMKGVGKDFKYYFFGGEDKKGNKRQGIFDSILGIFEKVGNEIVAHSKNIFKSAAKTLRGAMAKAADSAIGRSIANSRVGKMVAGAGKAAVNVAKTPFRAARAGLEGIDQSLGKRALKKGYNVYNRKEHRNMIAAERLEYGESLGLSRNAQRSSANFDRFLAGASQEELEAMIGNLGYFDDPTKQFDKDLKSSKSDLTLLMDEYGLDPELAQEINNSAVGKRGSRSIDDLLNGTNLSEEQLAKVRSQYNTVSDTLSKRNEAKKDPKKYQKELLQKNGILKAAGINDKNAGQYLEEAKHELEVRYKTKTDEENAQDKQDQATDAMITVNDRVQQIIWLMQGLGVDGKPKSESDNTAKGAVDSAENPKPLGEGEEDTTGNGESDTKVVYDALGNPHQQIKNNQGEWTEDNRDSDTKESSEKMNKMMDAICSIPLLGGAIKGIGGLFSSLKDGLLGDGTEKGEGLLSKLLGGNGFLGGIFNMFSSLFGGSTVATVGKGIMSAVKSLSGPLIAGGLLIGAFSGLFDGLFEKIGNLSIFKGNDTASAFADNTSTTITDKTTGNTYVLATDEDGNYITNEDGEYLTMTGEYVSGNLATQGNDTSLSSQMKKNLVTGALMGTGSVTTKVASYIANGVTKAAESNSLVASLVKSLTNAFSKVMQAIKNCPIIPSTFRNAIGNNADGIAATAAQEVAEEAGEKAATSAIIGSLDDVLFALKIVTLVGTAVNAWGNAESILGITEDATIGQKLIAVLVAVTNAAIPVIGNLIPNKTLVNIFMKIANMIGIDVSGLEEQREAAQAEVEAYNEENGTSLSIEEYNQMNGKAGIITKGVNAVKSTFTNIKEQGLGKTVSNAAQTTVTNVKNMASNFTDTLSESGLGEAVASTLQSILPGTIGDIAGNFVRMSKSALTGDFSGFMNSDLMEVDEDSGVIAKVMNTVLSSIAKIPLFIPAGVTSIAKKIGEFVGNIFNKIKGIANIAKEEQEYTDTIMHDPESSLSQLFTVEEDPDNPMGGIEKGFRLINRIMYVPTVIMKAIGSRIGKFFGKITNGVKTSVTNLYDTTTTLDDKAKEGSVSELMSTEYEEPEDNPLGGINKAFFTVSKVMHVPMALMYKVGNWIGDKFNTIKEAVTRNVSGVSETSSTINDLAKEGKLGEIWSYSPESDEENDSPINGFTKATTFITKLAFTPSALFHTAANAIGGFIDKMVDPIKTDWDKMDSLTDSMKESAADGDVSGVWSNKFETTDGNIIGPLFKGIFGIEKVMYTITALIQKVFGKVADVVGGVVDTVGGVVDNVKEGVSNTVSNAKTAVTNAASNAWSKVTNFVSGSGSGIRRHRRSGLKRFSGGASGNEYFVSQTDDRYSSIPLGNSTVGDVGCAPAAMTMLANFEKPGSLTMKNAIRDASSYQDENGTTADYFKSSLGRLGLSSNYTDNSKGSKTKDIVNTLANGSPAILLGEDASNNSKANSPFGPTGHYVMAKGFDSNGNIIIDDPESDTPNAAYSPDILNKVKLAVSSDVVGDEDTDAGIKYTNKAGIVDASGGSTVPDTDVAKNIWGFFTSNGFSPAATAGIMGNIYAESGVKPDIIQGNGKGPAAGLFQWENYNTKSSRWLAMNNYAASNGKDWTDLDSQLGYALKEIEGTDISNRLSQSHSVTDTDGKTYSIPAISDGTAGFKKLTDPVQAMQAFEAAFERAGKPNFPKRETAATEYYNMYSGSTYTGNYDSSVGSSTGGTTYSDDSSSSSSSSSSGIAGILSTITSAFSNAFSSIFNGSDSSSSTSSTDSTSSSSTSSSVDSASTPEGQGNAQSFIDIAKSQIGTVEGYDNITKYGKFTGADGQPWCASFVSWCMDQTFNSDSTKAKKALRGNYSAAVSGLWDNFKNANAMSSTPQPGDIVIYKNGTSHTGLVETVNGNNITTIEGNTSGGNGFERNGGMVARKSFDYTQKSQLTGFGRPDWDGASGAGSGLNRLRGVSMPKASGIKRSTKIYSGSYSRFSGGASSIDVANATTAASNSNSTAILTVLKSLLTAVQNIVTNTNDLPSLGTTVVDYCNTKLGTDVSAASSSSSSSTKKSNSATGSTGVDPSDDPALNDLMSTLSAIAMG